MINTTGSNNVAVGNNTAQSTTGSMNVAVGSNAHTRAQGDYNTLLGANTDLSFNNISYSSAIGYRAIVDASNTIVFGGLNNNNIYPSVIVPGNQSIGKRTSPQNALDVSGNVNVTSLTITGLGTGFVKSTTGVLSSSSIAISDVTSLQSKLTTIDASFNGLSSGSSIAVDDTVDMIVSSTATNVSNFANTWNQLNNAPTDNGVGVACSYDGRFVMKLGNSAYCYLSKDFGNTWSSLTNLGTNYQSSCSMSANGKYILLGTGQLSTDFGDTWSSKYSGNDVKVSPTGRYMVIVSNNATIYYSSDFGVSFSSWTDSNNSISWASVAISGDGTTAFAVRNSSPATVWTTANSGTSWTEIYSNPNNVSFGNISCSQDAKYILLGLAQNQSGDMYLSSNYGVSFAAVSGLSSGNYFKTAISANGMYMTAVSNIGANGALFFSKTYGATWVQHSSMPSVSYYGICMSQNATIAYAYAPNAKVFCFNSNIVSISTAEPNKPGQGGMYFDEATNKLYVYNSVTSAWKSVTLT
jgi:hypothetical protein